MYFQTKYSIFAEDCSYALDLYPGYRSMAEAKCPAPKNDWASCCVCTQVGQGNNKTLHHICTCFRLISLAATAVRMLCLNGELAL